MGIWGTGNYDSDGALDYIGDLMHELYEKVEDCFNSEDGASDLDEEGEAVIVPSVDIMLLLSQHCGAAPPKVDVVSGWKERYLAIFDEQIENLDPSGDYATERRQVIDNTFSRLEENSKDFWKED